MKNQKLLTVLIVITLLFSISTTVLSLLILKRNYLRDELIQATAVMVMGSGLDDEKEQPDIDLRAMAQVETTEVTEVEPAEQAEQPRPQAPVGKASTAKEQPAKEQPAVAEQPVVTENIFVDLGLPSGTLWKSCNEEGLVNFNTAKKKYKKNLPSVKQWKELKKYCVWKWSDTGYTITGPNGTSIFLPAEGYRNYSGNIGKVGTVGNYWSSRAKDSEEAWRFGFELDKFSIAPNSRDYGRSVRLVQKRSHVPDITDIE